jgi:hypothetical protein
MDKRRLWNLVGMVAGLIAAAVTRAVLVALWKWFERTRPPRDPSSPRRAWPEALAWAVASGASVAVSRVIARRGVAEAWKAATGEYPEGLEVTAP